MPIQKAPVRGLKKGQRLDDLVHPDIAEELDYKRTLKQTQLKLLRYQRAMSEKKRSLIVLFEGPDAAGKGGAIKRLVERLDPRILRVHSVVKPTQEEYAHQYLWRFWTKMPSYGTTAVFDRSWYGRVLVERVEHFATDQEWKRAYDEVNSFEQMLVEDGAIIVKCYLHISKVEQLSRFKRRQGDPYKHWKINAEDWRNRRKWKQHNHAAEEMFKRTSTKCAPWNVIPASFKWYARVKVAQTVVEAFDRTELHKLV